MKKRTLKFRAWNREQMVSPDYLDRAGHAHWKEDSIPNHSGVHNHPLMQFTGMVDDNQKEVFEGDIVQYEHEDGAVIAQVIFQTCDDESMWISGFAFEFVRQKFEDDEDEKHTPFEVIGNIYENPELLN